MKERISLLQVCKLPDVQLHSKTAFFKSIINKESQEAAITKEQIIKLSYTVKTIGVQGEQVGIVSKRLPLKFKKTLDNQPLKETLFQRNYLPHTSFYSQALIPARKQKQKEQTKEQQSKFSLLVSNSKHQVNGSTLNKKTPLKKRVQSMSKLKTIFKKTKMQQNFNQLGKLKQHSSAYRSSSTTKKKSFSHLLRQCNSQQRQQINPLYHEENPLFKKITRIKSKFSQHIINSQRILRYENIQRIQSYASENPYFKQ